ncbi:MAG: aspartate aminotransferase family protein [Gemmataceae bacterium]
MRGNSCKSLALEVIQHAGEEQSNRLRRTIAQLEPRTQRTYTPSLAVLERSAGIYHWTPEGRRLYDFTSGVLVANLGHNPRPWLERFWAYLGWPCSKLPDSSEEPYFPAVPLTAYNAVTGLEAEASRRLVQLLQSRPGGRRLEQVLWAASGSEAVQKALWAALARDPSRDRIIATRYGFHGKKGLAGATTGCETDRERDPRVVFISFPMEECRDLSLRHDELDLTPYRRELEQLQARFGRHLTALITEPYLGGGGSFHPPPAYLHLLQDFCHASDIVFILDEVQSNFGRTRQLFAFETYGLEPDIVILGKGMANGVPGAAAVGRADLLAALDYGEGSDTYSANPLTCAGVLATLDLFEAWQPLDNSRRVSAVIEAGLVKLKEEFPFIRFVRGEEGGMVWGIECADYRGRTAAEMANASVRVCYLGNGAEGVHLLGPLAKKVIRVAPPLVITPEQAESALAVMTESLACLT